MDVIRDFQLQPMAGVPHAVAIGMFDGVHRGHDAVIQVTRTMATELDSKSAVVTFDPHPASLVRPDSAPGLLTNLEQKLELLDDRGVDTVVVINFDEAQAAEAAEDFVLRVLVAGLTTTAVVVGSDFHFGKGRGGNVELLGRLGIEHGFQVRGLDLVKGELDGPESVSSTVIRQVLAEGRVGVAARLLGRRHEMRGTVIQGDQRGRTIGFPTANVAIPQSMAMPADAVYSAWYVRPDGSRHPAAVNIGKRPTFYQNAEHSLVEAHLIGFDGDLYGEQARVQLVTRIRPERRFDGIEELKAQLKWDITEVAADLADCT